MPSRRQFLLFTLASLSVPFEPILGASVSGQDVFKGEDVFSRIVTRSNAGNWSTLPIGELMGKIAKELEGTPYKANTLELSPDSETCSINLTALDCVTFFETTLAFARMLKEGKRTPTDLRAEVSFIRYRNGKPGDYTTRLHYMTDWLADNEAKHVVQLLRQLPGETTFKQKVGLMSAHPETSIQLTAHPGLIATIKHQEEAINKRSMKFVPIDKVASVASFLKTGDVVAICTSLTGLDVAHTGLIVCDQDGVPHFMDATSRKGKMRVSIESEPLTQALSHSKNTIGAMFARPLEPRT
jgi:hypothetical protein